MKGERWQQVERLYHASLERDADGRANFLEEACAGDEGLRREVESLLAYESRAENFIESPALEVAAKMMAEDTSVLAGQTIDHYKVISRLGAGGMGEVFLAEDTRLERRVALKFLPTHLTQDKRHLQRFQQEARAVAALSHPNVCIIHEVLETGEGRHCIVMEYVEGATLRERIARGSDESWRGARCRDPSRFGFDVGARGWRRAPRYQAGERHVPAGRVREGPGLRVGQADGKEIRAP